jgi:hypothetical protein
MKKLVFGVCIIVILFFSCASSPDTNKGTTDNIPKGPYFEGSGLKGVSLAVLRLKTGNLQPNEQWLLSFIQGVLTSNFNKYTAMTIIDRQYMDEIIQNQEISASGYFSDDNFISIGNLTNAEYILVGSLQRIQQINSFLIDFSLVNAQTGVQKASFPPTACSLIDIQNTTIIQTAFENIITQLNITLTESGRRAIHYINQPSITAESSLSKGIVAQENGRMGEALSFYYNAATFMPNTKEINSRISVLSSNVSSGNIGQNARNLISLRNRWLDILSECDNFLNEHIPFEIIYEPILKQEGKIDYTSGSVDLGFSIMTKPTDGFNIIYDVLKGLKKTGKQEEWGFQFWPFGDIPPRNYTELPSMHGDQQSIYKLKTINIEIVLLDESGNIISKINDKLLCKEGTRKFQKRSGGIYELWDQKSINVKPENLKTKMIFNNVEANKITNTMTIKIINVNGIDVETAGMNGYIRISTGKL